MSELSHQPCPDVANCGSSDAYSLNTDTLVGHCKSCDLGTWVFKGKIYGKTSRGSKGREVSTLEEYLEEIEREDLLSEHEGESTEMSNDDPFDVTEVATTVTPSGGKWEYRPMRGITKATMEKFDVRTYENVQWINKKEGTKGTSDEIRFKYPSGPQKLRRLDLDKDNPAHFSVSGGSVHELFGQDLFPAGCSKKVTIVEGEFDALAAYQMLANGNYVNPVVSLPSATPSKKLWKECSEWLGSFEEIILSLDSDGKANGCAEVLFDMFPDKVYVMKHGKHKDANDFLMAKDAAGYKSAWWNRSKYSPAGFTAGKSDWAEALRNETPYEYTETPIEGFNKVARGLVKGGITVIKAPPGTGKSSMLRMLQHNLVMKHKKPVGALMMEEMKSTTGRAMATYELGINVMTQEDAETNGVTEAQVEEALMKVVADEKFVSFDINPQDPIEDCLKQCKWAVSVYGVEYIFIDHLQRLAYLSGTEGATAALTELGVKLTEFAKRKNIGAICISHVNSDGKTKYASSIEEEAIVVIEMARDKQSEDQDEKNSTYLTITKNRPFAATGPAGVLTYDNDTTIVSERSFAPVMDSSVGGIDPFDVF